ncbi:sensor histidine kinase [Siculibacillus lacustris]|uniref:histidine kinase n=1 Tax=Siculibacillus lacustris TaxID=1549641 RepID=A0A4Q9VY78_9HYPH|nr:sensor histidine kinase [Siculibacillus lacustris]TBW40935.1 sensor histidine kinase [Siculibacillus lacustris]
MSTDEVAANRSARTAKNAQRAERRRHVARTVRDVRERLDSGTDVKPAFDWELMVEHARMRLASAPWVFALVAGVAALGAMWTDKVLIGAWTTVTVAAHLTGLYFAQAFLKTERKDVSLAGWRRRLAAVDGACGLAWAMLFLLPGDGSGLVDVFQFSAMLVVVAMAAILASNIPAAMFAATFPITVTTALGLLSRPGAMDLPAVSPQMVMAGMAATTQVFFILLGHRLYKASLAEIEARAEKDALIGELEQAKAISDESLRKAEEANFAKSRFLATMSHELRTPLNAILGFSEVMQSELMGPLDNAYYKGYVGDIHDSGRHLLELINEILDISRIEAGRYTLNEESITLPFVVEDCVHMMGLRARNKGLTLVEQYEEALPKIWADERALRQIVLNILSNAVKFTPSGGTVTIKVGWTAGGGQYVSIRDTGPGIPEEEIPIVLSRFGQGSIAIKSAEQGTGLGLNIVQALIKMHGGTFELKSKLREGTDITVTVPKSRVLEILPQIDERPQRRTPGEPLRHAGAASILEAMRRQVEG